MAKKANDNVFAASAETAKQNMKKTVQKQKKTAVNDDEEVAFTVRLKAGLHKQAKYYSFESGESMNSLIVRLLEEYLAED